MNGTANHVVTKSFQDPISSEDVEIVVKRALGLDYRIVNYSTRAYSTEKVGFMGAHHSLVVNVRHNNNNDSNLDACETHCFFVKSVPYDNHEQVFVIEDSRAFYCETNFYKCIVPELLASIEDKSWIARHYLIKDRALVLEDLRERKFAMTRDRMLNVAQLKAVLASLAKLHASSMLAEQRLGRTFDLMYPGVLRERLFAPTGRTHVWFQRGVDVAVEVARKLGLDHECVSKICYRVIDILANDEGANKVICFGDSWPSNLMFDDSEPTPRCIMVDYQWIRYFCGASDVAQTVYLSTTRSFRQAWERELLRHYYDVFSETLKKNNYGSEAPSFVGISKDYQEVGSVIGIVTTILYLPVTLMDVKLCTELTKDADGYAKIMFEDHADLVLNIMSKDEKYNDRITEVVREMVERAGQFLGGDK